MTESTVLNDLQNISKNNIDSLDKPLLNMVVHFSGQTDLSSNEIVEYINKHTSNGTSSSTPSC